MTDQPTSSASPAPAARGVVPVVIGVGQASERPGDEGYEALSAVDLGVRAAREALADSGAADVAALAARIDTLAWIRTFEDSVPAAPAPLGRPVNPPRSVAARLGIDPARAIHEVSGGQSPQHLLTELCGEVAAGRCEVALVVGGEAISTTEALAGGDDAPDFSDDVNGPVEDRGFGLQGLITRYQVMHHLDDAPSQYALFENARRSARGLSREEHAVEVGELLAPFTEVAAADPHAVAPTVRTAAEVVEVTEANRLVVDPYPRYVVAREKVNQGAAVLVCSEAVAEELGVPRERWVYLRGHADVVEQPLLDRADLGAAPAAVASVRGALEVAGADLDDVSSIDLYSCFPVAVTAVLDGLALHGLELDADDPRGLTVTGGLPFFGGAGNGYSLHAVAEIVRWVRREPGSLGLVGANGGMLSKYSTGVWSTAPGPWQPGIDARLQAEVDALPRVPVALEADGWATVETWTVKMGRTSRTAVVVARLDDGRRFLAVGHRDDDELVEHLLGEDPAGTRVAVRHTGPVNLVALSEERLEQLAPTPPVGLRESYEHLVVRREGRRLEITIDRPEVRNALTPEASLELSGVLDAYLADPDLWVAVLTGATSAEGKRSFCAGNDLGATASRRGAWLPRTGFGGLTSRRGLRKPVIAAVEGIALGGGFELALASTLVVAGRGATFGLPEVKVGLVAAAGGLVRLPRTLPPHLARELVLTGRRMGAEEAARWGVVNRVVDDGEALEAARALADEVLAVSPTSVRVSLEMMEQAAAHPDPVDAVEATTATGGGLDELLVSQDTIEGVTAFVLGTEPRWRGR